MTEDTSENRVIETEENDSVEAGKMYTGKTKISDVIKFAICNAGGALGIPTEFHSYPGLQHGFGIGTGTIAEGWINGFGL